METPPLHPLPFARRDFLAKSAALSALAVLAGACGDIGLIFGPTDAANGTVGATGSSKQIVVNLADYPALAQVGAAARISGVSPPLALVNVGNGTYLAFSLACPHQGATVQSSGNGFVCPRHGARFAADGTWTGGLHTSSLRRYATTYDAQAGTVVISR
jgi:Rieske Fe-S protein